MFYYGDFNHKNFPTHREFNPEFQSKIFTVILETNNKTKSKPDKYSIVNAAKPLAYYASIFGTSIVTFTDNEVYEVGVRSKMYTILVIVVLCLFYIFVSPLMWAESKADIPLHILTRSFSYLTTAEVIYIIFISTIGNSEHYIRLLKKLDDFDQHFRTSEKCFIKGRVFAVSLIFISVLIFGCFFLLHKAHKQNTASYFIIYMFILQGTVSAFILANIHIRLLIFNDLLLCRLSKTLPWKCKTSIFEYSLVNKLVKALFLDSYILRQKLRSHFNWFELMQMYDKAADCVYLFNKIYAGQALLMFQSSLISTMLIICRYLSPSLKHSYWRLVSDFYVYLCITMRPIYLAKMCDVLSDQRNKTLLMLMKILEHSEYDEMYRNQLQTIINLVNTRKMEITCTAFTVDLQTTLNFSGRVISYTVVMIQYFYMHVFSM